MRDKRGRACETALTLPDCPLSLHSARLPSCDPVHIGFPHSPLSLLHHKPHVDAHQRKEPQVGVLYYFRACTCHKHSHRRFISITARHTARQTGVSSKHRTRNTARRWAAQDMALRTAKQHRHRSSAYLVSLATGMATATPTVRQSVACLASRSHSR